ncbi:hypothetical protein LF599_15070 [Pseudodesulfovibrio thermohalotolerans]|uniref:hypothetical protein n=1 Tax=Pseudodesulfovibrio thermohalotolerans TaxID=2880651 RepID=UPI00244360B1|nr:hypothetical protein [Pseudodesulfovibrio thermohalotolerans]WFS61972.1 hypothetical protein LF599_15070 [Pseudodesulfovibrio thermohalotolerans]
MKDGWRFPLVWDGNAESAPPGSSRGCNLSACKELRICVGQLYTTVYLSTIEYVVMFMSFYNGMEVAF